MSENYFQNLRTVGANVDVRIAKLQETWKMPHLLLCKNNEKDELIVKKFIENLRIELKVLKETVEDNKISVAYLREIQTQFLEESIKAINSLKEEVDDTKILFTENGYLEEPIGNNLSVLNDQIKSLFVGNNDLFIKNLDLEKNSINTETSVNNISFIGIQKKSDEQPMNPLYSPYYYKIMKK